ncbi:MAG: hypothetical protein IJD50_00130 [Clostridia bacterium]|nr:hypothetical protein [Clostridia bacterium]
MRKAKRMAKAKALVVKNLTYIRLKNDLAVIENEMNNNQPVEKENGGNVITKFFNGIVTELSNTARRKSVVDLSVEKKMALDNLTAFERENNVKELELASDVEKLKKYMNKELFKKDAYGIQKIQFALSLMLDNSREYVRNEESLQAISAILFNDEGYMNILFKLFEQNYYGIQKKAVDELQTGMLLGVGVWSLVVGSWLPVGIGGIATIINHLIHRSEMKKKFQSLSKDELQAFLAMKLTVIETTRKNMPESARKDLIDDLLKYVSNLRGDAEYEWLIEKLDAPANKEKIELCNLTVDRLSRVIGI